MPDARRADARTRPTRPASTTPSRSGSPRPGEGTASPTSGSATSSPGSTRARARTSRPPTSSSWATGRPGQPAAARRQRPRADRDPHQLHRPEPGREGGHRSTTWPPTTPPTPCRPSATSSPPPRSFRPHIAPAEITEQAARHFAEIAQGLRDRGHDPEAVAHFLDRILFCLFAEDAGLLPKGIFQRLSEASHGRSSVFSTALGELFAKMAKDGGLFGTEEIDWFNGGLFESGDVIPLDGSEITTLLEVSRLNWALIEPAIFGTLFERGLDPGQRAQLGAHYTDRDAIWGLVEPVILRPLRREYAAMQERVTELLMAGRKATKATPRDRGPGGRLRGLPRAPAARPRARPRLRLRQLPDRRACGPSRTSSTRPSSGARSSCERPMQVPQIGPEAVLGIEINAYAAELARVTIWIGEIQWMIRHGLGYRRDPILRPLDHIETRDAILDLSDPANPREAEWPEAEFIVGNPPFLGGKLLRAASATSTSRRSVRRLRRSPPARVRPLLLLAREGAGADRSGPDAARRAPGDAGHPRRREPPGARAHQGDRRHLLRPVRRAVDPRRAPTSTSASSARTTAPKPSASSTASRSTSINANLTSGSTSRRRARLPENAGSPSWATSRAARSTSTRARPRRLLASPNPDGRSNRDVVRPWVNGLDITRRPRGMWIIDFGVDMTEARGRPVRGAVRVRPAARPAVRARTRRPAIRRAVVAARASRARRCAQPSRGSRATSPRRALAKHRLFAWLDAPMLAGPRSSS